MTYIGGEANYYQPPEETHFQDCPCHPDQPQPQDGEPPDCLCEDIDEAYHILAEEAKLNQYKGGTQ